MIQYLANLIHMVFQQYRESLKKWHQFFDKYQHWRSMAKYFQLSPGALARLEWLIYYETKSEGNVSLVCRHFGIRSRKTFYKWRHRFDEKDLRSLEEQSRAPINKRQTEIDSLKEQRIIALRRQHPRWGKEKLEVVYSRAYQEKASSWHIQKTIEKYKLYYHPKRTEAIRLKRRRAQKKRRITELKDRPQLGFTLHLDTIVIYWNNLKRYIITAIDQYTKIAFARMYTTHSSFSTADFLYRLNYLLGQKITNIHTDNGSEFQRCFHEAVSDLHLEHYFSRNRTPKDNASNERFNRTLKEEFIDLGNFTPDLQAFNKNLTEWLIEYNFERPHLALDKLTPIEYAQKYHQLLAMCPSNSSI